PSPFPDRGPELPERACTTARRFSARPYPGTKAPAAWRNSLRSGTACPSAPPVPLSEILRSPHQAGPSLGKRCPDCSASPNLRLRPRSFPPTRTETPGKLLRAGSIPPALRAQVRFAVPIAPLAPPQRAPVWMGELLLKLRRFPEQTRPLP